MASITAKAHGYTPDSFSVVLSTRPDALFTTTFSISGAITAFGAYMGGRLAFGQDGYPAKGIQSRVAKSEALSITSYIAYENPIAKPLGEAEALRAMIDSSAYA